MEALLLLANFSAMVYILIWGARAETSNDSGRSDQANSAGLLAFGKKPFDKIEPRKPKYWRKKS